MRKQCVPGSLFPRPPRAWVRGYSRTCSVNWFDRESNDHKCGCGGRAEFWHVGVTKYRSTCPITDHVLIVTFCLRSVWPRPFISLLLRLEGPIGVLFTPIPSSLGTWSHREISLLPGGKIVSGGWAGVTETTASDAERLACCKHPL